MTAGPRARPARPEEMDQVMALRHAVFCVEQGVPEELERDDHDAAALHVVALDGDRVVATCRLLAGGDTVRLGRMAVARALRGRGVGAALLEAAHAIAAGRGATAVEIHAQTSALGFWERAGYVARGPRFEEAGITHVAMRRPLGGGAAIRR